PVDLARDADRGRAVDVHHGKHAARVAAGTDHLRVGTVRLAREPRYVGGRMWLAEKRVPTGQIAPVEEGHPAVLHGAARHAGAWGDTRRRKQAKDGPAAGGPTGRKVTA